MTNKSHSRRAGHHRNTDLQPRRGREEMHNHKIKGRSAEGSISEPGVNNTAMNGQMFGEIIKDKFSSNIQTMSYVHVRSRTFPKIR